MTYYEFSANGMDLGTYCAETQKEAQEDFAMRSGYTSWEDMVDMAKENGGNNVEVVEISEHIEG